MDTQLTKQTSGSLTYTKQPEEFLKAILQYLETVQNAFRSRIPESELLLWRETLKDYSFQEFDQAMQHLIRNPPKYEVGGEIQVWTGLPKLPDVVRVMLDKREKNAAEFMQQERTRAAHETTEHLEHVKQNPEEYVNVAEGIQGFLREMEAKNKKVLKMSRMVPVPVSEDEHVIAITLSDSELAERRRILREQMRNLYPGVEQEVEELKKRRPELFTDKPEIK